MKRLPPRLRDLLELLHQSGGLLRLELDTQATPPACVLLVDPATDFRSRSDMVSRVKDVLQRLAPDIAQLEPGKYTNEGWGIQWDGHRLVCERLTPIQGGERLFFSFPEFSGALEEEESRSARRVMVSMTLITLVATLIATFTEHRYPVVGWIFYGIAYIAGGYFPLVEAIRSLRSLVLNVDFLMVVAALGAAYLGHPQEGAILLFLFTLSSTLETFAMDRSRRALRSLLERSPDRAELLMEDGSTVEVVPEVLQKGQRILLRPGSRVPTDVKILKGEGHFNEADITGESIPRLHRPGERVPAGAVVVDGSLEAEVLRPASESTLTRTLQLIQEAREQKAQAQRIADVFERVYTWGVVIGAFAFYALFRGAFGLEHAQALYRSLVFLVVASPCAIALSAPTAVLSAIAHAARKGILFKGGVYVETLGAADTVAFDKTGTLTRGEVVLEEVQPLNGFRPQEVLKLAASLESRSEHPLAQAVVRYARREGIPIQPPEDFRYEVGQGVRGRVQGKEVFVGKPEGHLDRDDGRTVVMVRVEGKPAALLYFRDELRPEARRVVQELLRMGKTVVILTGDRRSVGDRVGRELGVERVFAELLPEDKVRVVRRLQEEGRRVAMVGDGVNDGPVLASADVGVAIGGASTDVAMEVADVVLMKEGLEYLPYALRLSAKARRVIFQNFAFALGIILVMVGLNVFHAVPLTLGVVAHEGSTVVVILNGLRLLAPLPEPRA